MARSPKSAAIEEKIAAETRRPTKSGGSAPKPAPAAAPAGKAISRQDLATAVAEKMDMSRAKATEIIDTMLGAIGDALKANTEVRLTGFGTFATSQRKATTGRNPRTGEQIDIAASTSVKFKPGKALKDSLAG